jgi:hypothetical protein
VKAKCLKTYANTSGSVKFKNLSHAQRIEVENCTADYNTSKSHPGPNSIEWIKMYAELMGNHKN